MHHETRTTNILRKKKKNVIEPDRLSAIPNLDLYLSCTHTHLHTHMHTHMQHTHTHVNLSNMTYYNMRKCECAVLLHSILRHAFKARHSGA